MTARGAIVGAEFEPDGIMRYVPVQMENELRVLARDPRVQGNPNAQQGLQQAAAAVETFRQMKVTWKKQGRVYTLRRTLHGQPRGGLSHFKLQGDRLMPCDPSGNPRVGLIFTRVR